MTNQPINLKIITCGTLSLGVKYTMNSGENSVDLVSDGTLMIDGGTAFGQVPRIVYSVDPQLPLRHHTKTDIMVEDLLESLTSEK